MKPDLHLKIIAFKDWISITGDMHYSSIYNMYNVDGVHKDGEGIQVNEWMNEEKAKIMCRKITEAIKEYLGEKNGKY